MDFKGLAAHLLLSATRILPDWLPGGHLNGKEYCCGDISGGSGDSFRVNTTTGIWCEFAGDLKGADLISLYAAIRTIKPGQAYIDLCREYNYQPAVEQTQSFKHFKHGYPVSVWHYQDATGATIMHVARYNTPSGKQFCPFSYNNGVLQYKSLPNNRPLYNLPAIIQHPDRPVIIVEGEKAATALQSIVQHRYTVTTWPGGCRAHDKTDFKPLQGYRIILWPDADNAGRQAMNHIEIQLSKTAKSIKTLRTNDLPDGYDAADFEGEWPAMRDFITDRLLVKLDIVPATASQAAPIDPDAPLITGSMQSAWEDLGISVNRSGNAICNIDNVTRVLEGCLHFRDNIWFDTFLNKIQYRTNGRVESWSDTHDINTAIKLQRYLGLTQITDGMVFKAVSAYARQHPKNCVTDYLSSQKWNRTNLIDTFFIDICGSPDNEYTRAVSRNFILSLVARAFKPGCKADCMPILECGQGVKKSTMLSVLVGQSLFANATSNVHHVDFFQCLQGKWLVEFAELHQFSKADITKLKDIMSTPIDTYRVSYGRTPGDYPRQSIFAGTTNETTYLSDNTGARRFWPIEVKSINIQRLRDTRDQLFAEATFIYQSEHPQFDEDRTTSSWWIMPKTSAEEQESRRIRDPWEDDIHEFIKYKSTVTTQEIIKDCLKIETARKTRFDEMRIGSILRLLKMKRKRIRIGDEFKWAFVKVVEHPYELEELGYQSAGKPLDDEDVQNLNSENVGEFEA
jgi:predicted P-loop ATPase/5S rRNA maturation endonuclease (ribonuclease M5)